MEKHYMKSSMWWESQYNTLHIAYRTWFMSYFVSNVRRRSTLGRQEGRWKRGSVSTLGTWKIRQRNRSRDILKDIGWNRSSLQSYRVSVVKGKPTDNWLKNDGLWYSRQRHHLGAIYNWIIELKISVRIYWYDPRLGVLCGQWGLGSACASLQSGRGLQGSHI